MLVCYGTTATNGGSKGYLICVGLAFSTHLVVLKDLLSKLIEIFHFKLFANSTWRSSRKPLGNMNTSSILRY